MIFSQDRSELRKLYINSWIKAQNNQPLTVIEEQLARIIEFHPEYHSMMNENNIDTDYTPESGQINPFLHIGLHLAVIEQYQTNRPNGIRDIYTKLLKKYNGNEHQVHHSIMDYLAEEIWKSQKYNKAPNDQEYLNNLKNILHK